LRLKPATVRRRVAPTRDGLVALAGFPTCPLLRHHLSQFCVERRLFDRPMMMLSAASGAPDVSESPARRRRGRRGSLDAPRFCLSEVIVVGRGDREGALRALGRPRGEALLVGHAGGEVVKRREARP